MEKRNEIYGKIEISIKVFSIFIWAYQEALPKICRPEVKVISEYYSTKVNFHWIHISIPLCTSIETHNWSEKTI